jgi:hypothetical protein
VLAAQAAQVLLVVEIRGLTERLLAQHLYMLVAVEQ